MKLYLNDKDVKLVEKALKVIEVLNTEDGERARKLLERMEHCKELQNPHKNKPT